MIADARRRDRVLRAYIVGRTWDLDGEQQLRRHLVVESATLMEAWPLLVGVDWPGPDGSPGDLLFFDGTSQLAAVEVKCLGSRRNAQRNLVERQARMHAAQARGLWPSAIVIPLVYSSDERDQGLPPRSPDGRR